MTFPAAHVPRAFSRAEEEGAARVLGREHGLVRALAYRRAAVRQMLVVALPLLFGAAGTVRQAHAAPAVLGAAGVVEAALLAACLLTKSLVRERAQELIAAGWTDKTIPSVASERRRLLSEKERESLARSLERALYAAEHWDRIAPASRPPHGVRCLRFTAREVRGIVLLLRTDVADARGVALTARFLAGGYSATLYGGDSVALRKELNRIHYLLTTGTDVEVGRTRLAASKGRKRDE
jgi:hypothetical protein